MKCHARTNARASERLKQVCGAGSVPLVLRVTNQDLIAALKKQEMVGTVRLGAFAQIGQTSATMKHSSSMDDDLPTCDPDVPAEELESIGTLAQLKGMTWSTQDNVEQVCAFFRPSWCHHAAQWCAEHAGCKTMSAIALPMHRHVLR